MRWPLMFVLSFGALGCESSKVSEPPCEAKDQVVKCFCPDGPWGTAVCQGVDDRGECDCVGRPAGGEVIDISLGGEHSCAVIEDGSVLCWGSNALGQLGDGTREPRAFPAAVVELQDAVQVAVQGVKPFGHSCARLADGTARCWGDNILGQLGDGSVERSSRPVEVMAEGLTDIAVGLAHSCASNLDGNVLCWGANDGDQLGFEPQDADPIDRPTMLDAPTHVTQLALGRASTCALDLQGAVWCWGDNDQGQLGDGTREDRVAPEVVSSLPAADSVRMGRAHACARVGREVHCWGDNQYGQLGTGDYERRTLPAAVEDLPPVRQLSCGSHHCCALDEEAGSWCWGRNDRGQLGDGTKKTRPIPRPIPDLRGTKRLASGGKTACALDGDGLLQCWGDNRHGQLGDGTSSTRPSPEAVRWIERPAPLEI